MTEEEKEIRKISPSMYQALKNNQKITDEVLSRMKDNAMYSLIGILILCGGFMLSGMVVIWYNPITGLLLLVTGVGIGAWFPYKVRKESSRIKKRLIKEYEKDNT